ncbi:NRT1-PTR FAMILY 2-11 protein [Nymphaea thermarum]|nr:NRT1-PTR FAMILY 2-11 protein [Nymphaea thermarum]
METKEEVEELTVTKHKGWKAMPYVLGNETFEKLGSTGMLSNLIVYLTTVFHMKQVDAAILLNVFSGTTNLAPVVGAFLSDSYFGRYATLGFACVATFLGMLLVTLTAGIPRLHPPHCKSLNLAGTGCIGPSQSQLAFLLGGLAFLVVGAGGIRPCNLAFGADQFNPKTESGRKGINSFFNWYYFTFTSMMMVSLTIIVYVQVSVSWTLGLAIPTTAMFFSCVCFFLGTNIYVKIKPEGSPFTSLAQVFVACIKKRKLKAVSQPEKELFDPPHTSLLNSKLHHTDQFRFLDKAATRTPEDTLNEDGLSPTNPWRLCSNQKVEEAKCLLRVIPIWSSTVIFYMALSQQTTYAVLQAMNMDRHIGKHFQIPAGSFIVVSMLALTLWLPLYDRVIVSAVRRITKQDGGITLLQRMGIGLVLCVISMVVSGIVEARRRRLAVSEGILMSSLWLIPQFAIAGLAEAFNIIGQVEFYYKQFPENMRSVSGSFLFLGMAAGNYMSSLFVSVVHKTTGHGRHENWLNENLNHGRLDFFYYVIAGCGVVNFVYFIFFARWYRYKGADSGNQVAEIGMKTMNSGASHV